MNTIKRFLLCTLLLVFFAGLAAVIGLKAIYPPTFFERMLVEDGLMVTFHKNDAHYATMKVYNSENPAALVLLSTTTVRCSMPQRIYLYHSHIYIPEPYGTLLRRYSLLDPSNPVLNFEYASYVYGLRELAFNGNLMLMSTQSNGLRVVNIANGNNPSELGGFSNTDPLFRVWTHGNKAAVLSYNLNSKIAVLKLVDISNPANPTYHGAIAVPGYYYGDSIEVAFHQNHLHLIRYNDYTKIYDIHIPGTPMFVGNLENAFTHSVIQDDVRYSDYRGFFRVQNMTGPATFEDIATFEISGTTKQYYTIDLPYVYMIRDNSDGYKYSFCLDLSDLEDPEGQVYTYDTGVGGSVMAGTEAWLYFSSTIAQLKPPGDIVGLLPFPELIGPKNIRIDQGIMHTINRGGTDCSLYSIDDPANPVLLSTIAGNALDTYLFGDYFFLRDSSSIKGYNICEPANPVDLFAFAQYANSMHMEDDIIWVAQHNSLDTYQLNNGLPVLICSSPFDTELKAFSTSIAKRGNYVYLTGTRGDILVYDVSDPHASAYAGHALLPVPYDGSNQAPLFTANGKMLVITGFANQAVLYDLSNPGSPEYLDHHSLPYKVFRAIICGDRFLYKRLDNIYCMQMPGPTATEDEALIPAARLSAGPNPFSGSVSLTLELSETQLKSRQRPEVQIYNIKGQKIRTLGTNSAGQSPLIVTWDGRDKRGISCPNGIYLAKFMVDGQSAGYLKLSLIK